MWDTNFKKYAPLLWVLIGINIGIGFLMGAYIKVQGPLPANLMGWVWIPIAVIQLFLPVVLITDVAKSKLHSKGSWIAVLAVTGLIGSITYLWRRDKLMAMGEK